MDKQERCEQGFEIYVESMAKSIGDKAEKIIPLVLEGLKKKKGDILDLGAGAGDLTGALHEIAQKHKVKLVALDRDSRMIEILEKRFSGKKRVKIIQANASDFQIKRKFAVVICSSFLHEVFSQNKDLNDLKLVLQNIYSHLHPKGTLIIRDGIKPVPSSEKVFLQPLKSELLERFRKILDRNGSQWLKIHDYYNLGRIRLFIGLSRENAYELTVKYQYPEINWSVEMKEKFGFWTREEAKSILEDIGFEVVNLESYPLPYFTEMFARDFKIFGWQDGPGAIEIPYFDTHLIIATQK